MTSFKDSQKKLSRLRAFLRHKRKNKEFSWQKPTYKKKTPEELANKIIKDLEEKEELKQ